MSHLFLLGLPVEVEEDAPPGILRLVAPDGEERLAGIGKPEWIYEAHASMTPSKRAVAHWVTRKAKDLTEAFGR